MTLTIFALALAVFAALSGFAMTTIWAGFPDSHVWIGCAIGWAFGVFYAACSGSGSKYY